MNFLEKCLENPSRRNKFKQLSYLGLILIAGSEIILPWVAGESHHHFDFEGIPAWGSIYGLISCVVIIVVSKLIGKIWLSRREDHYDA